MKIFCIGYVEDLWNSSSSLTWFHAFTLPMLPWTRPFLPMLGCPQMLLDNTSIWEEIYIRTVDESFELDKQAVEGLEDGMSRNAIIHTLSELRTRAVQKLVIQALEELAKQMGIEVAIEWERFVRLYFFRKDVHAVLWTWKRVFMRPYFPQDGQNIDLTYPKALEPIIPEIKELLSSSGKFWEIEKAIRKIPSKPLPDLVLRYEPYRGFFLAAIKYYLIIQSLRKIATTLSPRECQEVRDWALRKAVACRPTIKNANQFLNEEGYLQVEFLKFEMPSILAKQQDDNYSISYN